MFPFTFIEVGNTLSYQFMAAVDTTTTKSLTSLTTTSLKKLTQHLLQHQQQETARAEIWKNSLYMKNVTQTSLSEGTNSSESKRVVEEAGAIEGDGGFDNLDETDSSFAYVPPLQRPETIFITILFLIIFIVGVLGNGTLVLIFLRHRSMRNVTDTYILSLAFADLLIIIVCVPLAVLVYTTDSWTFGKTMCQLTEFFKDVSIGVSVFTLTVLSGERYCAIVNPFRKLKTRPLTVITAAMIWVLSITLATPSIVMSDLQHILIDDRTNLTIIICTPFGQQRNNSEIYARYVVVTKAFVYYLLPLLIIGVLYMMMAHRLHVSAREMPGEGLGSIQSRSQVRGRRYVARMVVAFVGVFFICFFPYHLFELWFHLNPTAREDFDEFWHTIRIIGFCTYFLNSCLNPVALYCVSGTFRTHFNQYLFCFCVKRRTRHRQHSTATGMMDTSIVNMSLRSAHHYNRDSPHLHNAYCTGGCGNHNGNGLGRAYNHHSCYHPVVLRAHNGNSSLEGGRGVSFRSNNGRLTAKREPERSGVILDKR